jgi:hypothetical protein
MKGYSGRNWAKSSKPQSGHKTKIVMKGYSGRNWAKSPKPQSEHKTKLRNQTYKFYAQDGVFL